MPQRPNMQIFLKPITASENLPSDKISLNQQLSFEGNVDVLAQPVRACVYTCVCVCVFWNVYFVTVYDFFW